MFSKDNVLTCKEASSLIQKKWLKVTDREFTLVYKNLLIDLLNLLKPLFYPVLITYSVRGGRTSNRDEGWKYKTITTVLYSER